MIRLLTVAIVFVFLPVSGCVHPKVRYHKAYLLDPMMDPAKSSGLRSSLMAEPMLGVERDTGQLGGAIGQTCPTCGG